MDAAKFWGKHGPSEPEHPAQPGHEPGRIAAARSEAVRSAAPDRPSTPTNDWRRFFAAFLGALISAPIERLSLLHLMWWLRRRTGASNKADGGS